MLFKEKIFQKNNNQEHLAPYEFLTVMYDDDQHSNYSLPNEMHYLEVLFMQFKYRFVIIRQILWNFTNLFHSSSRNAPQNCLAIF